MATLQIQMLVLRQHKNLGSLVDENIGLAHHDYPDS